MRFRPCIDIHNGKIKQIVGGSLLDQEILQQRILYQKKMVHFMENFIKIII